VPRAKRRTTAGPRVALDPGAVRVGVASSDPESRVAVPVGVIQRVPGEDQALAEAIAVIVAERSAAVVYVGLPRTLRGGEGAAAVSARELADLVAETTPEQVQVRLVDERLTTVQAERTLSQAGSSQRQMRSHVDAVAASTLLQHVLDAEQRQGTTVGQSVHRKRDR
jgi:putative Holliday junction resolvase